MSCIALAAGWLAADPSFAGVRLDLDRTRVTEGETVTLTFLTDDPKQSLDADFSVLQAAFDVLNRRSETQMSFVNGTQTASVRLVITLEPKHEGDLLIPALQFPGASSNPLTLKVTAPPALAPGEAEPVAALGVAKRAQALQAGLELLRRAHGELRIGGDGIPAIAQPRRAAHGPAALAAHPDGRVRALRRFG